MKFCIVSVVLIPFIWILFSGLYCIQQKTYFFGIPVEYQFFVSRENVTVFEEWTLFKFDSFKRYPISHLDRIECGTQHFGKNCHKYRFDVRIEYIGLNCISNNTIEIHPIGVASNSYYGRSPVRSDFTTHELVIEKERDTPEFIKNYFQFNQTLTSFENAQPRYPFDRVCPVGGGWCYTVDDGCAKLNRITHRIIEQRVKYETRYHYTVNAIHVLNLINTTIASLILFVGCMAFATIALVTISKNK